MPSLFKKSDLSYEAGQVKRKIVNDARRGRIQRLNKQEVFALIAARPRVGLRSDRALWNEPWRSYLDDWYDKLVQEVEQIRQENTNARERDPLLGSQPSEENINAVAVDVGLTTQLLELERRSEQQQAIIRAQQRYIDKLRIENEQMRVGLLPRHSKIDV